MSMSARLAFAMALVLLVGGTIACVKPAVSPSGDATVGGSPVPMPSPQPAQNVPKPVAPPSPSQAQPSPRSKPSDGQPVVKPSTSGASADVRVVLVGLPSQAKKKSGAISLSKPWHLEFESKIHNRSQAKRTKLTYIILCEDTGESWTEAAMPSTGKTRGKLTFEPGSYLFMFQGEGPAKAVSWTFYCVAGPGPK